MDPINPFPWLGNPHPKKDKPKVEKKKKTGKSFSSVIKKSSKSISNSFFDLESDDKLEDLLDEIHERGDNLKEGASLKELLEYKKAVKKFIKYVINNTLESEIIEGAKFNVLKRKQKKYTLIKVIDTKLEQLAAGVMQNHAGKLNMLTRIEEIQGLIVDLLS